MAEGWRMWAISLLTIMLLTFLSAAPIDITDDIKKVDVKADDDAMHSHDENVTRGGKLFGHNQFDLGNINVPGNVAGDDVSIGHQVNIDVQGHTHDHHLHEEDTVIGCKEGLRILFKSIDSNKNGLMDAKELLRVCHQNNIQITESLAVRILTLPDKTVGFNMAKFCELLKDSQSTNGADLIYFLLQLFDKGCEVHVGKSTSNTISATVSEGCVCPIVVNKGNWLGDGTYPDEFKVTQDGSSLQVQRTDSNIGWSMDLSFMCNQDLEREGRQGFLCLFNDAELDLPPVDGQASPVDHAYKWENNLIPYFFTSASDEDKALFESVMDIIGRNTCFKFIEETEDACGMKPCLEIMTVKSKSCSTGCQRGYVGITKDTSYKRVLLKSDSQVGDKADCTLRCQGFALHELMHVLGVGHTVNRRDRDSFIEINEKNAKTLKIERALIKCENCLLYDDNYDCSSIMHMGTHLNGTEVLKPKDPNTCSLKKHAKVEDGPFGSDLDWKLLNAIGNCPGMCTGSYQEPASQSGNRKSRPAPYTKCVEFEGKVCVYEEGRWGSSWCYVDDKGTNWGAECVPCKGICTTDKGACIFPFTYKGKTYNGCTKYEHNQAWCATKEDQTGNWWGNCPSSCQMHISDCTTGLDEYDCPAQGVLKEVKVCRSLDKLHSHEWCTKNCRRTPANCPEDVCKCKVWYTLFESTSGSCLDYIEKSYGWTEFPLFQGELVIPLEEEIKSNVIEMETDVPLTGLTFWTADAVPSTGRMFHITPKLASQFSEASKGQKLRLPFIMTYEGSEQPTAFSIIFDGKMVCNDFAVCAVGEISSKPCFCNAVSIQKGEWCLAEQKCNEDGTCFDVTSIIDAIRGLTVTVRVIFNVLKKEEYTIQEEEKTPILDKMSNTITYLKDNCSNKNSNCESTKIIGFKTILESISKMEKIQDTNFLNSFKTKRENLDLEAIKAEDVFKQPQKPATVCNPGSGEDTCVCENAAEPCKAGEFCTEGRCLKVCEASYDRIKFLEADCFCTENGGQTCPKSNEADKQRCGGGNLCDKDYGCVVKICPFIWIIG